MILIFIFSSVFAIIGVLFFTAYRFRRRAEKGLIAFFHPYCNAGGGGERVLWCALRTMQEKFTDEKLRYVIYTGDVGVSKEEILNKAKNCFDIDVSDLNLDFVYLRFRWLLEAKNYPIFTLTFQAFAGFIIGLEALWNTVPEVFIDTMGCPLTMPLFKWFAGSKVACYIHYPTISSDMIQLVESKLSTYNNAEWISRSNTFSCIKVYYYQLFALIYKFCGFSSDVVIVNSRWTKEHIIQLWNKTCEEVLIIYPPCGIDRFSRLESNAEDLLDEKKLVQFLSVGQIRPEKNHRLQIEFIAELKRRLREISSPLKVRLIICGGCRNEDDILRVIELKKFVQSMGLTRDDVLWELNIQFDYMLDLMKDSLIGVHTMKDEHFGISVVEGIAAGQIMIANDSGGPKMDIMSCGDQENGCIGFLASQINDYLKAALNIIEMTKEERDEIRRRAKKSVRIFDERSFALQWNAAIRGLIKL